jgi:NADPH:quinone reductase-like Zn-dependent oxidoreductase/SAM-dependent methyltransferase
MVESHTVCCSRPQLWGDIGSVSSFRSSFFPRSLTSFDRYCAGYLNHKSALKISFYRGLLSSVLEKDTSSRHAMAAVGLSVEDIRAEIAEFEENVTGRTPGSFTISCINSSQSVTIAGPKDPLAELIEHLAEKQIFARLLKVDVGYHSPQMLRIASDYNNLMNTLEPGSIDGRSMMVSSVTSLPIQEHEVCRPEYWVRNMVSTVNFLGAVNFCCSKKRDHDMKSLDGSHINQVHVDAWLEIGPHSALQGPLGQILRTAGQKQMIYTSALSRNQSALQSVLAAIGYLHCQNFKIDMRKATSLHCSPEQAHGPIPKCLPPYPFNHSVMYWDEAPANADFRLREHASHDLVGSRIGDLKSQAEAQWRFIIKAEQMPWVQDHKIQGSIVYPAAGTLTMVIEAAKQLLTTKIPVAFELKDVEFPAPVQISSESRGVELRLHLSSSKNSGRPGDINYLFRTFLRGADGSETQVCSGTIQGDFGRTASDVDDGKEDDENLWTLQSEYRNAIKTCTGTLDSSEMYEKMRTGGGLEYGPAFQTLSDVAFNSCTEAIATSLPLPSSVAQTMSSSYTVHPSRLDGLFQLGFSAMNGAGAIKGMIPTRIDRLWIPLTGFGHPETTGEKAYSKATHITERNACFSIAVFDHEDLHLKARIEGLELTAVSSTTDARKVLADAPTICLHVQWKPDLDTMNSIEIQGYCEQAKSSLPAVGRTKTLYDLTHSYSVLALQSLRVREQACGPVAMHPSMRRYTSWLSQHVDMSSVVNLQELDVIVAALPSNVLVDACTTVGQNLLKILLGEINPSELLFQDKAQKARFHEELLAASVSTVGSLTRYLDSLVHKRPDLHFCEIGASSSAMTKIMLNTLANPDIGLRYAEYMVTDVDEPSLESTRGIFSGVPRVRFQCLNIEQSPLSQGFEKATYDVVVLDLSLCGSQKADQCIAHVHSLLKPGGKLILKEMTTDRLLVGFVLGLFGDKSSGDQGAEHQIPDITRWHATLREYGFSGTDLAFQDLDDITGVQWNIMVSTSANLDITEPSMDAPILVLDRQSVFQQSIAAEVLKSFDSNQGLCMLSLTEAADLAKGSNRDFIVLHELETPLLRDIIEDDFVAVKTLLESAKSIIWAKKSDSTPDYAINEGMMRVSRHENYQTVGVSLALETSSDRSPRELAGQILNVFRQTPKAISNDYEPEYREQDGMLCVNRVVQAKPLDEHLFLSTEKPLADLEIGDKRLKLSIRTPGILDTLEFIEDETMKQPLGPGEIEVEVRAVGVNFKDVMTLLGRVPGIEHLGSEFAGIVTEVGHSVPRFKVGDRVVGAYVDAYRTHARIPFQVAFLIPDDVSFAEAASIPTTFRTAYYCLYNIASLQQGESVLIHRASGGTGQAAVQLAMMTGAKVFATVGSKAKKQLLIDQYGLPEDHILYSRDTSFADGIMRLTQGRGVDVVLNSLSGNLLEASWDIIAPLGRFVEIGLGDALSRQQLPMFPFAKGVSFCSFNLNNFMTEAYFPLHTKLMDSVWSLFTARKIRPSYPMQVHSADKLEDALRWLLGGDSSGKAVIQIEKTSVVPVSSRSLQR